MNEIGEIGGQYGSDGLEAEFWLDQLTTSRASDVGEAVARHNQVGETVLAAIEAGGDPEDVAVALVMSGAARRLVRFRDRLPFSSKVSGRHKSLRIELT